MVFSNETAVAVLAALGLFVVAEAVSITRALVAERAVRRARAAETTHRRRTATRIPSPVR